MSPLLTAKDVGDLKIKLEFFIEWKAHIDFPKLTLSLIPDSLIWTGIEIALIYLFKEEPADLTVSDSVVSLMNVKAMCGTGRKARNIYRYANWSTKWLKNNVVRVSLTLNLRQLPIRVQCWRRRCWISISCRWLIIMRYIIVLSFIHNHMTKLNYKLTPIVITNWQKS